MATKRTPIRRRGNRRITPKAIDAWLACDYGRLQRELGLLWGERSPLPYEVTALGSSEEEADSLDLGRCWDQTWELCIQLQRELVAIAGWPNRRKVYEKALKDAQEYADWCQGRVDDPRSHGISYSDPSAELAGRMIDLANAREEVAWRKQLLDELPAEVK